MATSPDSEHYARVVLASARVSKRLSDYNKGLRATQIPLCGYIASGFYQATSLGIPLFPD
jgi:hypothetical protein